MIEGFWIVQFEGVQGGGGGVAVFIKDRVFGGDSGYTYEGSYELKDASVRAKVLVQNFIAGVPNILGITGNFELRVEGKLEGDVIKGTASPVQSPGVGIAVKLTKRANLS